MSAEGESDQVVQRRANLEALRGLGIDVYPRRFDADATIEATVTAGSLGQFLIVDLVVKPTLEGDISCRRPIGNGR